MALTVVVTMCFWKATNCVCENVGTDAACNRHGPVDFYGHEPLHSDGTNRQVTVDTNLLKISYVAKNNSELISEGFDLGFDEITLENQDDRNQIALAYWQRKAILEDSISVTEDYRYLTLTAANFTYRYDTNRAVYVFVFHQTGVRTTVGINQTIHAEIAIVGVLAVVAQQYVPYAGDPAGVCGRS